ncbi:transcriptional repressor [bacterium]|nr:transcriptional repressor [bacterium]
MNYSKQREIIYNTLKNNAVHPTADSLFEIIKKENPDLNIGIATVYRNLKLMSDIGMIKKISGLEDAEHFDHNTFTHYHFICDKCKKVFDVDADIAPVSAVNFEKQTGFSITGYDITFHGICNECNNLNTKTIDKTE